MAFSFVKNSLELFNQLKVLIGWIHGTDASLLYRGLYAGSDKDHVFKCCMILCKQFNTWQQRHCCVLSLRFFVFLQGGKVQYSKVLKRNHNIWQHPQTQIQTHGLLGDSLGVTDWPTNFIDLFCDQLLCWWNTFGHFVLNFLINALDIDTLSRKFCINEQKKCL